MAPKMFLFLVLGLLLVCTMSIRYTHVNQVIGSFPTFERPYDEVKVYLLYTAFPWDTTSQVTLETAGPAFVSFTSTHCGVGFRDSNTREKWSVELEPLSFEGQFVPSEDVNSGEHYWSNQANIRIRRHLSDDSQPAYWQSSKLIASATAASISVLELFLRVNALALTSDLQPFSVLPAEARGNSSTLAEPLLVPKTPFTFARSVLQQLATEGVVYDAFATPLEPVLAYFSTSPSGTPLRTAPLSSDVTAWFQRLSSCLNTLGAEVRGQSGGLGGVAFLSLSGRCYGAHAFVFKSASEVYNVTLLQPGLWNQDAVSGIVSPTASLSQTPAACVVHFSAAQSPLVSFSQPSRPHDWAPQDLALVAMLLFMLSTGCFLLARFYYRQMSRRRVSLSGEDLAHAVVGELLQAYGTASANGQRLAGGLSMADYFFAGRASTAQNRGCVSRLVTCVCGWCGWRTRQTEGPNGQGEVQGQIQTQGKEQGLPRVPPLLSPNSRAAADATLAAAAQRRSLRLNALRADRLPSALNASSSSSRPTSISLAAVIPDATPVRPKFPLSQTPNDATIGLSPMVTPNPLPNRSRSLPREHAEIEDNDGGAVTLTPFAKY